MFLIILVMMAGIGIGWCLRRRQLPFLGRLINVFIWLLLFLLGVEVGGDRRIVEGMASLGGEALAVAAGGVAGSCLLAWLLWRWAGRGKGARKDER